MYVVGILRSSYLCVCVCLFVEAKVNSRFLLKSFPLHFLLCVGVCGEVVCMCDICLSVHVCADKCASDGGQKSEEDARCPAISTCLIPLMHVSDGTHS